MVLIPALSYAQQGKIRGKVIDDGTGEALFGVTVVIKGTTKGGITDFDGAFEINVEPGAYDIQASFVSYKTVTVTGVEVRPNDVTVIDQIRLAEDVAQLEEVVIKAEVINSTESALMTLKRKSVNVMDGISAAAFRKIGDTDAAEAAKRVTGVSVEGGKYIYVRGLGDRYTKTTLNGVDIPGLDPDRNTIQIDIFPTNLIDNMVIMKSFVPELPADFTGGIVNIETKDFPEEKVMSVSISGAYNPSMHFNSDYITYQGSNTDFLGFDGGTRSLPEGAQFFEIPSPSGDFTDQEINSFLKSFNPTLGASNQTSPMNFSMGLTLADQFSLNNGYKIGYIVTGTYKNTTRLYDDMFFGEYQLDVPPIGDEPANNYEMIVATTLEGILTENNVLLGGLGGIALKTNTSKYKFNAMHLQNGESRSAQLEIFDNGSAPGKSGYIGYSNNLEYNERSLTNLLLNGAHYTENGAWKVDWKGAVTISDLEDPDIRKTAFTVNRANGDSTFQPGAAGLPNRIWRSLDEINIVGKLDVINEHKLFSETAKLKFGVNYTYKERDYLILEFNLRAPGRQPNYGGDPNNVLTDENLYPNNDFWYLSGNNDPNPNEFNSNATNLAAYMSYEFSPVPKLKSILGLRMESFVQRHTGRDAEFANNPVEGTGNNLDNEKVLDATDFFPSINFIYALTEEQNLRLSYSRTIARPSFKELSFAQILDPVSNRIFNGGLFEYPDWDGNLTETRIENFDIRWEMFMDRNQMISLSGFYKSFDDPIELVRINSAFTTNEFQPRNVGNGELFGMEFEFRKSLSFISNRLENFSVNGNVTYVESSLEMSDEEFNNRKEFEKFEQNIENTRNMAGQAPYVINAGLSYNNPDKALDAGFFYNVKGRTLIVVGSGYFPDVYSEPFHSLNFNLNKAFGSERKAEVNFSVSNILNDVREEFFTAFRAEDQIFQRWSPGVEIGVGFSYRF
jgi:hypothetical protein